MIETVYAQRLNEALRYALGPVLADLLAEDGLTDLMVNADGRVFVDRLRTGRVDTGHVMHPKDVATALALLADHCGVAITQACPILSATMPVTGERVAGTIPPVTLAPTMAIRRPPKEIFPLSAFAGSADDGATEPAEAGEAPTTPIHRLMVAVARRMNVLIAGSTGSGKTSLASALLQLSSVAKDRCLVLEDTQELAITAPDHVRMMTTQHVTMRDLVRLSLRYRGDRLIIGEIRSGDAALEFVHAMNVGHSGSFCTIHANSARDAVGRLEDLCGEVTVNPPRRAIEAANLCVAFVTRTTGGRAIQEVLYV